MATTLTLLSAVLVVSLAANRARSADPTDPISVIDRALKAGGGTDKISKFRALTVKAEGKMAFRIDGKVSGKRDAAVEGTFGNPDRVRLEFKLVDEKHVLVIDGSRAWVKSGASDVVVVDDTDAAVMRDLFHALSLPDRLITLKGNDYRVAIHGEETIDGNDSIGIRVMRPKFRDVFLYFDKASGLPTKSMIKMNDNSLFAPEEVWMEFVFDDYKAVSGVQHFTRLKVRIRGEDVGQFELKELMLLEKLDLNVFKKP